MSVEILAEITIIFSDQYVVNKKRRLEFNTSSQQLILIGPKDEREIFEMSRFTNKRISSTATSAHTVTNLSLSFDSKNPKNKVHDKRKGLGQMKITLKPPYQQYTDYVRKVLDEMLQASQNEKPKPTSRKPPPEISSPYNATRKPESFHVPPENSYYSRESSQTSIKIKRGPTPSLGDPSRKAYQAISNPPKPPPPSRLLQIQSISAPSKRNAAQNYQEAMIRKSDAIDTKTCSSFSFPSKTESSIFIDLEPPVMKDPDVPVKVKPRESKQGQAPLSRRIEEVADMIADSNGLEVEKDERREKEMDLILNLEASNMDPDAADVFEHRKLKNIGNSCYFNSTLQALSACAPFASKCSVLFSFLDEHFPNGSDEKTRVFRRFLKIVNWLRDVGACAISSEKKMEMVDSNNLEAFRRFFGVVHPEFANSEQQDAHEFLTNLLSTLDDVMMIRAMKDGVDLHADPIRYRLSMSRLNLMDVFRMKIELCFKCQYCDREKVQFDSRIDLSLAISDNCSVQDLLSPFAKWTAIERRCPICDYNISSTSERIVKFPACLIVNLKRYERNVETRSYIKNSCSIRPSFDLDLSVLAEFAEFRGHPELDVSKVAEQQEDEEIIFDKQMDVNKLKFEWIAEVEHIEKITESFDMEPTKKHVESLKMLRVAELEKKDKPGKTKAIEGDGNCFYRSISWCLTGTERFHDVIRKKMVHFVDMDEKNWMKRMEGYSDVRRSMETDGEWAMTPQIIAVATMLNITIYTYLDTSKAWIAHSPRQEFQSMFPPSSGAIYLQNIDNHYQPVISLEKMKKSDERSSRKRKSGGDEEWGTPKASNGRTPRTSCPRGLQKKSLRNAPKPRAHQYTLSSAVCHLGDSPDKGHYVAYTKSTMSPSASWTYCSDENVHNVSREQVETAISTSGYVLFYTRAF